MIATVSRIESDKIGGRKGVAVMICAADFPWFSAWVIRRNCHCRLSIWFRLPIVVYFFETLLTTISRWDATPFWLLLSCRCGTVAATVDAFVGRVSMSNVSRLFALSSPSLTFFYCQTLPVGKFNIFRAAIVAENFIVIRVDELIGDFADDARVNFA